MTLVTSTHFASVAVSGADWRDISRRMLEQLEPLRRQDTPFTLGFLYVTDHLAGDIESMLDLIRSVTGVDHWVGSVALGVCGNGVHYIDTPAASIMLGSFAEGAFQVFPVSDLTLSEVRPILEPWMETHDPMLCLVHSDPLADQDPGAVLAELERLCGGFIVGGMTSSRKLHVQIADQIGAGGVGGVLFSSDVPVATTLSQGCAPLGPVHTITRCEDHVVMELDGRSAFEVFTEDLKNKACACTGQDFCNDDIEKAMFRDEFDALDETVKNLFRGEVHVAFPVAGSDQSDYLVRNLIGIDPESGCVAVSTPVAQGDTMMFVHRDEETVSSDLVRSLTEFKARITRQQGRFDPKGAVYISCVARAMSAIDEKTGDIAFIKDILGDVPLTGFYANGEISNRRLYGYTGILILFL